MASGSMSSTVHYQSEHVLAAFHQVYIQVCAISFPTTALYFVTSGEIIISLEALEVSICWLRNTLIKLIAFMLPVKLLNCVIWNKKNTFLRICQASLLISVAALCMARIPQRSMGLAAKRSWVQKGRKAREIWARNFKDTQTPSAVLFISAVLILGFHSSTRECNSECSSFLC